MTRHQYGISTFVPQTSFRWETSGGVTKCPLFQVTEDFSHLKANEGILNFKTAYPTSVYVFKIVLVVPGLTYASLACVQTSPLPQEKSIFPEGGGTSVHRLMPHLWLFYGF